ncbi:SlyX family protein [Alsobacter sp. KACC 23698]|uniref:Protein SlyX homolog n=1 Tax=Alsobacter sp. KACC 23698 TaxID=3149229 RepID=A0AAU7JKZ9_9HYPH
MTSNDPGDLGARVDTLEVALAYQDDLIEQLNATVTEQARMIDMLKRRMDELKERVLDLQVAGAPRDEPPPPHY